MQTKTQSGFYAIGIYRGKTEHNIGTLWRTAYVLGASYIFTVGKRYKKQTSDVVKAWSRIPLFHYDTMEELCSNIPYDTRLIGVEMTDDAIDLHDFEHPQRGIYLLGAEDAGLPNEVIEKCHMMVKLKGNSSINVAVSGSIICHDRVNKIPTVLPPDHRSEISETR